MEPRVNASIDKRLRGYEITVNEFHRSHVWEITSTCVRSLYVSLSVKIASLSALPEGAKELSGHRAPK